MASQPSESERTHRRETLTLLVLPVAGAGALVVIGAIIALLLPRRAQVSIIADLMLTVMVLCPAALCLFPLTLGFIAAAFGLGQLHDKTAHPLRRIERLTEQLARQTHRVGDRVNRAAVSLGVRTAPLERLLSIFEQPLPPSQKDEPK